MEFHARVFQPANVTVLVTGRVDGSGAARLVEAAFSNPTNTPPGHSAASSGTASASSGVGSGAGSGATPASTDGGGAQRPTSVVTVQHRFHAPPQRMLHVERVPGLATFQLLVTRKAPLACGRSTHLADVRRSVLNELVEAVVRLRAQALLTHAPVAEFVSLRWVVAGQCSYSLRALGGGLGNNSVVACLPQLRARSESRRSMYAGNFEAGRCGDQVRATALLRGGVATGYSRDRVSGRATGGRTQPVPRCSSLRGSMHTE